MITYPAFRKDNNNNNQKRTEKNTPYILIVLYSISQKGGRGKNNLPEHKNQNERKNTYPYKTISKDRDGRKTYNFITCMYVCMYTSGETNFFFFSSFFFLEETLFLSSIFYFLFLYSIV